MKRKKKFQTKYLINFNSIVFVLFKNKQTNKRNENIAIEQNKKKTGFNAGRKQKRKFTVFKKKKKST